MSEEEGLIKKEDDVVTRAKKHYARLKAKMDRSHEIGRMCMSFVAGDQWSPEDLKSREATNRPVITMNKLDTFARNVVNRFSMESPRITVSGFEDADVGKTRVINGLLRHIQYSDMSDAGIAIENAMFDLVVCGFGYMMVDSDYIDDESMDQELLIKEIDDPFTTFVDKDRCAIIVTKMEKEAFHDEYGEDKKTGSWDDMPIEDNETIVVQYWEKTSKPKKLYKIIPAQNQDPIDAAIGQTFGGMSESEPIVVDSLDDYPGCTVVDERESKEHKIIKYTISGNDVVLKEEVDGTRIPVVMVSSQEYEASDGRRFLKPLVYDAIPAQRIYNYYRSQDVEYLQMQTKVPFLVAEGQLIGHESEWESINTSARPYQEYRQRDLEGNPAPMPQRQPPPQMSQGFYNNMLQASDEIKATIGIFDASLGAQGNETSGRAILARTQQGDVATYHHTVAMKTALRELGLIVVDQIPKKYDTARTIRILGDDMTPNVVKINQNTTDSDGRPVLYDLTVGKYDVVMSSGPSGYTRRMAMVEDMRDFIRAVPQAGMVAGDFLAKSFDFEHSEDLSNRLKAAIDPAILERAKQFEQGNDSASSPQMMAAQQQLAQMQQQMANAMRQLQSLATENQTLKRQINDTRIAEEQIKAQAAIQKEGIQSSTNLKIAQIDNAAQMAIEKMKLGITPPAASPFPTQRPMPTRPAPGTINTMGVQNIRRE